MNSEDLENNPSAAKAGDHFAGLSGTTKVVPFQNGGFRWGFSQPVTPGVLVAFFGTTGVVP